MPAQISASEWTTFSFLPKRCPGNDLVRIRNDMLAWLQPNFLRRAVAYERRSDTKVGGRLYKKDTLSLAAAFISTNSFAIGTPLFL